MLSLVHLKYFRDAALLGSLGAAAKRNFVSPSAVSQAIKSLESHFDVELLEHAKNQFVLTAEGRLVLDHCHLVFTAAETLEDELNSAKGSLKGEVIFATQQSIAHYLLPGFITEMKTRYPEIRPNIRLATTDVAHQWIQDRTVDFAISVNNFGDTDLMCLALYHGSFVFVEGVNVPKKLGKHRGFILPGETTRESKTFKSNYQKVFGKPPNVLLEIKSWGVIKTLAETGFGVGLIPDYLIRFDQNPSVREVKIDLPTVSYSINAYYCKKRQKLSRQSQVFLAGLEDFVGRLRE